MASPFDRLMETIRPHLPGAIDNAIRQELFGVCQTFFEDSNVWREDLDYHLDVGQQEAEIMPYTGRISRLIGVVVKGTEATVKGVILTDTVQGTLYMQSPASEAGDYTATVALTVSDPVSRDAFPIVPVDMMTKHWMTIMHGALAAMFAQPKKPYTDLNMAAIYTSKFRGGIARARNYDTTGNTKNSQNWTFPQSFNRR